MVMFQDEIDRGVLSVRFFDLHLAELVSWGLSSPTRVLKLRWPAGFEGASTLRLGYVVAVSTPQRRVIRVEPADEAEARILAAYEAAIAQSDAEYLKREDARES